MPESTGTAEGVVKLLHRLQIGLVNFLNHHLGDSVTAVKCVRRFAQINHGNLNLTPIVGVNRAG